MNKPNKNIALMMLLVSGSVLAQAPAQPPAAGAAAQPPQDTSMSYFVTSVGLGKGANLGGLAGADAHCKALAEAAGTKGKSWHAYLSTTGAGSVNAKDRIGKGPWYNANGILVARSVEHLHYSNVLLTKETSVTEKKGIVNGVGDTPNQHDMLTGSDSVGRAFITTEDRTCKNWTSADPADRGFLGHSDRLGGTNSSWNSAHPSAGCDAPSLVRTGGSGRFYCFAIN